MIYRNPKAKYQKPMSNDKQDKKKKEKWEKKTICPSLGEEDTLLAKIYTLKL